MVIATGGTVHMGKLDDIQPSNLAEMVVTLLFDRTTSCSLSISARVNKKTRWFNKGSGSGLETIYSVDFPELDDGGGVPLLAADVFVGLMDVLQYTVFENIGTEASEASGLQDIGPLMEKAATYVKELKSNNNLNSSKSNSSKSSDGVIVI